MSDWWWLLPLGLAFTGFGYVMNSVEQRLIRIISLMERIDGKLYEANERLTRIAGQTDRIPVQPKYELDDID